MSYNLKNKTIVMIAVAFAIITMSHSSYAEDAVAPLGDLSTPEASADDMFGLDMGEDDALGDEDLFANAESGPADAVTAPQDDFLLENTETNPVNNVEPVAVPQAEAPKSPFESYGNSILSRVDNDLFNQMSTIEKQTTLLNLELKREEVRDRIEALKQKRVMAEEQDILRKREMEQKLKETEIDKQKELMTEEQKLKDKQIELERIRQGKVLKDYMNEMLVMNQEWIAKNAALYARIRELENERRELILSFEDKFNLLRREAVSANRKAEAAVAAFERSQASYNSQLSTLKKSISDNEDRLRQAMEGNNSANPFANGIDGLDENAIDMSQEYAIMDITGKGNDVVAKIVSRDGTTFIVHKGSMLKGGEVVTSITDNYVAFDNQGVKSYLYTGGTIMEYEPVKTFNGSDKTPETTPKQVIKSEIRNVWGTSTGKGKSNALSNMSSALAEAKEVYANSKESSPASKSVKRSTRKNNSDDVVSFGQGMFVK